MTCEGADELGTALVWASNIHASAKHPRGNSTAPNHADFVVILGRGQLTNWQSLQNSRGV